MKKLLIIGAGNHAKVILSEILKIKKYSVIGFVDDKKSKRKMLFNFKNKTYDYLGNYLNFLKNQKINKLEAILAIGSNYSREAMYNKIKKKFKNLKWAKIISKDAIISKDIKIGEGSVVMSGCVLNSGTTLGKHCFVNTSSSIDHDNQFQDFSSVGPGVTTGGNVSLNKNSYIGIGTTVMHNITIKENTVIGGNSFVNKNCSSYSVYYGSPAKKIRKRKKNSKYL